MSALLKLRLFISTWIFQNSNLILFDSYITILSNSMSIPNDCKNKCIKTWIIAQLFFKGNYEHEIFRCITTTRVFKSVNWKSWIWLWKCLTLVICCKQRSSWRLNLILRQPRTYQGLKEIFIKLLKQANSFLPKPVAMLVLKMFGLQFCLDHGELIYHQSPINWSRSLPVSRLQQNLWNLLEVMRQIPFIKLILT